MEKEINIVYAANNKYAKYLCVTVNSLIENTNSDDVYNIYLLEKELYASCKDGIIRINEIQKSGKNRVKAFDYINGLK